MRGLLHFTAVLWLVIRGPVASAQSVEIEGGSAMLNDDHVMRCNLVDFTGSTATLQYEWRVFGGDVVVPRSTDNTYLLPSVAVTDALTYECRVYMSEEAEPPLATGTSALNITIPDFAMRFTRDISSISRSNYVGLNISYGCETRFPLAVTDDLTADVEIFRPGDTLIEGSDGRVRVGPPLQSGTGGDFERSLYFDPISAADRGTYRCTGTVRPVMENSLVTNGRGEEPEEISVFDPSLAVEISGVIAERYLDIAPYNTITLTCTAMLTLFRDPVPGSMRFSWLRAVGGSSPASLPAQTFTDDNIVGPTGVSMLTVSAEEAGSHTYSCVVSLDVSPATDNITETGTISLEVTGPTSPSLPVDLMAVEETLSSDSATIQWRVVAIQYAPEVYTVVYGTTESNLTSTSDQVSTGEDITRTNFELSVELMGLQDNTRYYYQVVVNNTEGVAESSISSFTTTDLPPTPPRDLTAAQDMAALTTFVFSWAPPTNPRGGLVQYELTCQPVEEEAMVIRQTSDPTVTMATVTDLVFRVSYECSVRARNMAAYSQPSEPVTITVSERAPGVVTCGDGWEATPTEPQNVTVQWSAPADANGITLRYLLTFLSFSGEELASANVSADNTQHTFTSLTLSPGVPYNVSIVAQNSAGVSTEMCFQTDFSDQLFPTLEDIPGLQVVRSDSGTSIDVSWQVLSLEEARGFLQYLVRFQPVTGRGKRQEACTQSPCRVNMEEGGISITGLDAATIYTVSVQLVNGEEELGETIIMTVSGTPPTSFPLVPVIVGVVAGVVVLAILVVAIIVILCCCCSKKTKEYSVPGTIHNMELEKRQDYVNDTVLCDQPPLYTPVPVKERMRVIPVSQFTFHVQDMHAGRDTKFEVEYESLGNDKLASCEIAQLNKAKNRFANIFPYDFSRVKLSLVDNQDGTDYINASYIDGYKQANAYVAAQGPMPNTIGDFWRMVWEHKLTTVVMLTKVNEAGKKKCEQYWPENVGQTQRQPNTSLEVTFKELLPFADYEIRKLEVVDVSEGCTEVPLSIVQYHFLGWPDHGVPKFATSLIEFIRRVRHSYKSDRPILVHCSAGVGRTGTYVTLDSMLERIKETDNINVYEFVRNMRAKRVLMVQTQAQYMFIHDALEELITCGETSISAPELRDVITSLSKVNPSTPAHITYFEEQFQLLNKVSRVPTDSDLSDALQHYNESKNRYQDKIPYNNNRVRLRPSGAQGGEYINASFVDGYKHRNAYITTQGPLETTVQDFWRMIWEFKSKVIVMLCQTREDGKESSCQYWPEEQGQDMVVGKLQVTLRSEKVGKEYVERKLEVKELMTEGTPGQKFEVTQFHYQQWPEHDRPPMSTGLLQLIKSLNNAQRNTGNKPVTVMCNDGVGRTGSFICIHAMLERVNTENILDFFQFIKSSRIHRPALVMELEHYRFCHDALADYLNTLDSYANFKDLS